LQVLGEQVVALLQLRRAKAAAEDANRVQGELLERLHEEQERSERLLLSLFPKAIAERLKHEAPDWIADEHPEVTILFAHVTHFWHIAGSRPARNSSSAVPCPSAPACPRQRKRTQPVPTRSMSAGRTSCGSNGFGRGRQAGQRGLQMRAVKVVTFRSGC
jgi:hypothetical protein